MKKRVLLVTILIYRVLLYSQTSEEKIYSINQIQGIWQMVANYKHPTEESFYKIFHIYKNQKCLSVDISENPYDKLSVTVSTFGFCNSMWRDSVCALGHLSMTGMLYVEMDEYSDLKDCFINLGRISLAEKSFLNLFNDECWYLEKAPKEVLDVLFKRGKRDKRDYIKEFLDIKVVEIVAKKSTIFSALEIPTKMYLIKGDIVTILDEKGDWVKIEFEGKQLVQGWIKKLDVQ